MRIRSKKWRDIRSIKVISKNEILHKFALTESYKYCCIELLESVVKGGNESEEKQFDDIESLKNRFYNLRKEYNKLITRQVDTYKKIEKEKKSEKEILTNLQNELYMKQVFYMTLYSLAYSPNSSEASRTDF